MTSLDLIDAGLALVPIPIGCKGPAMIGWDLPENTITTPQNLDQLEGGNIGLAHAYCKPTPTCALDIDLYKHAKEWLDSHGISLNLLLLSDDAVVIHSGKPESLKLLYRLPVGTEPLETKRIVTPDSKTSLEFRCATKSGKTVQDVLPPSLHPSGQHYRWLGKGDPLLLPQIPPGLLAIWHRLVLKNTRVSDRSLGGLHTLRRDESPRQIAIISDALSYVSADCNYELWRNVIWALLSTGWTCAEDLALRWSNSAPHRFDEIAFWLIVNSYMPSEDRPITIGTLYYHARLGGWHG